MDAIEEIVFCTQDCEQLFDKYPESNESKKLQKALRMVFSFWKNFVDGSMNDAG